MKRLALTFLLFGSTVLSYADSPYHDALRSFAELAQTCKASADNCTDADELRAHTTIVKIARNGGKRLQLCHLLDNEEAAKLCAEITADMEKLEHPKRQVPVAGATARRRRSLPHIVHDFKKAHQKTLAKPTTTKRLIQRIALKTAIEVAYKNYKRTQGCPGNARAAIPTVGKRLESFRTLNHGGLQLKNALEYAGLKIFAQALTDEFFPTGISTQKQKLLELVVPSLLAEVIARKGKVTPAGLIMSVLPRLLLTRFYMDRTSKYYKYVNTAALVLPFLLGPTLFPFVNGIKNNYNELTDWQRVVPNALVDGFVSTAIFDGVPALMDRLLPNTHKNPSRAALLLNKKTRRKWTKNFVRDLTRQWVDGLSGSSFA
ncbi:MAG: hypothetical protein PVJ92_01155 [Candidatus Dependentiae bacterium]|jgi:hypothetical protein